MNQILQDYDNLRKIEVPLLRCGETIVPATDAMPGFLQAAMFLVGHLNKISGSKRIETAYNDVTKWIAHVKETGSDRLGQLEKWEQVANLLKKSIKK